MPESERQRALRLAKYAAVAFVALLGLGTLAFATIGGESVSDAFYRAWSSFTGAGLVDPPRTRGEKVVAALLVAAGGLFFLFLVSVIVQALVRTGAVPETLQERRTRRALEGLSDHTIVCGFGNVGRAAVEALRARGEQVVVIDRRPESVRAARLVATAAIDGEADEDATLRRAGVDRAKALIASLGTDADNLYIALAARRCNQDIRVVARASGEEARKNLESSGAFDHVTTPYMTAGRALAEAALG